MGALRVGEAIPQLPMTKLGPAAKGGGQPAASSGGGHEPGIAPLVHVHTEGDKKPQDGARPFPPLLLKPTPPSSTALSLTKSVLWVRAILGVVQIGAKSQKAAIDIWRNNLSVPPPGNEWEVQSNRQVTSGPIPLSCSHSHSQSHGCSSKDSSNEGRTPLVL